MDDIHIQSGYRNRVTLFIYYGMCALVLLGTGIFLLHGNWESAVGTVLIFILMFVPSVLKTRYRLYLPFALDFGIVAFIFFTLFLGEIGQFYDRILFWDKFLHFQSGLLLGAAGYVLVYILNEHQKLKLDLSPALISIFAVTFSLSIGVIWEMFEFAADSYFSQHIANHPYFQESNIDTMWDLIAAGGGALIVSVAGYFWMFRHKRLPFTPQLLRIFKKRLKINLKSEGESS
ncbi:hypothetical protein A3H15_02580 [Candidatus Kaiserbacteria bacterium RIFCSPLOWO2_12_FULL_50_28]|uniref:DUF2238 domain-containing protein n=1 Tax=Candidatus Kaiserbacteria bacterium RIFCSPLOWO2_12_FULL_50_28 TaxID=1798527 RepID=A0A1F6FQV3_9BACT|nr:MAG: hypothetical protein A3H15_02580 [Candidatus Kaiserbacteria bacterium RIFCSPLOWO2_12_FULL_50_28]